MAHIPSRSQKAVAVVLGIAPVAIGINAMVQPAKHLEQIGLLPPTAPSDRFTINTLLYVFGIRQLFIGGVLGLAAARGDKTMLGGLLLLTGGIAAADALLVWLMDVGGHGGSSVIASVIMGAGAWILGSR